YHRGRRRNLQPVRGRLGRRPPSVAAASNGRTGEADRAVASGALPSAGRDEPTPSRASEDAAEPSGSLDAERIGDERLLSGAPTPGRPRDASLLSSRDRALSHTAVVQKAPANLPTSTSYSSPCGLRLRRPRRDKHLEVNMPSRSKHPRLAGRDAIAVLGPTIHRQLE